MREIVWQEAPLTAGAVHIDQRIDYFPEVDHPRPPGPLVALQQRL
jgi:hypothetical protein